MPDSDTEVIDLCRHTPRKWKAKMRPFRHMTEKFRRSLADDVVLWAPVVKALGLKID
jgi:hypothetical protein